MVKHVWIGQNNMCASPPELPLGKARVSINCGHDNLAYDEQLMWRKETMHTGPIDVELTSSDRDFSWSCAKA
jgi:hypothetical protein